MLLGIIFGLAFVAMGGYELRFADRMVDRALQRRGPGGRGTNARNWRILGCVLIVVGLFGVFTAIVTG
jgi:hypothetical protein